MIGKLETFVKKLPTKMNVSAVILRMIIAVFYLGMHERLA